MEEERDLAISYLRQRPCGREKYTSQPFGSLAVKITKVSVGREGPKQVLLDLIGHFCSALHHHSTQRQLVISEGALAVSGSGTAATKPDLSS